MLYRAPLVSSILLSCWVVWAVYWKLQQWRVKPAAEHYRWREQGLYFCLMVAGFVLALSELHWPGGLSSVVLRYSTAVGAIGVAAVVVGTAVAIWARWVLATNWSADVAIKKGHELVTGGPYRLARHPIYTGMSLMFIGTAVVQGTLAAAVGVVLALVSFWLKLELEEKVMLRQFGEQYAAYQQRVKRIIPFLL